MCSKTVIFSVLYCFAALASTVSSDGVVLCYYGMWSISRPTAGQYGISDLPVDLCTHIAYSFVAPTTDGDLFFADPQRTINGKSNTMDDFKALKKTNPNVKLMVAIGGGTTSSNFTVVVNNDTIRAKFVENLKNFLDIHGLDGLDLDWEYPRSESDKQQFAVLVKELRTALGNKVLTAAVGVLQSNINRSYLVAELNQYLDYINLMTYNYHGQWENTTGANAPLFRQLTDPSWSILNVNQSVYTWIRNGASPSKLVLGIPAYGKTFTLASLNNTATGAPATGAGAAGPLIRATSSYSYGEICSDQNANATLWSITEVTGSYVYANKDLFWVGYDNPNTAYAKAKYAKEMGLAGIMYWAADLDDFSGLCGVRYPLISAGIAGYNGKWL